MDFIEPDEKVVVAQGLGHTKHDVESKKRVAMRVSGDLATPMRLAFPFIDDPVYCNRAAGIDHKRKESEFDAIWKVGLLQESLQTRRRKRAGQAHYCRR